MSPLCQRWASEVVHKAIAPKAETELAARSAAETIAYRRPEFQPYTMADVHEGADARSLLAMSMFAGGGGSCIGLHLAGFKVVAADEFVPEAARTYRKNFPQTIVVTSHIRQITATRASVEAFLASFGMAPGDADVIIGSPPCSEFSSLGGGIADPGITKSYSDTSQTDIASLIFDFVRFNRAALPRVIISENVPPLAGTYRPLLEDALDQLRFTREGGPRLYYVADRVLTASDYGVPQARRRVLILAVRSDVAQAVGLRSDADIFRLFPSPVGAPVSIREGFRGLNQTAEQIRPARGHGRVTSRQYRAPASAQPAAPHATTAHRTGLSEPVHADLPALGYALPNADGHG